MPCSSFRCCAGSPSATARSPELSADEAAVSSLDGDPAPLASAMLAVGELADPAVVGIAPERVDHLLGRSSGWGLPGVLLGVGAASIALIGVLAWQVGRGALLTTSLNLPLLSSQPCVVVLALVPFALTAGAVWLLRRSPLRWA